MKHRNEFDIHSTSKNQQKLKTVVIDLRYKWVLKTQCRIFEFFLCVKSNWMEVVMKLFIFITTKLSTLEHQNITTVSKINHCCSTLTHCF